MGSSDPQMKIAANIAEEILKAERRVRDNRSCVEVLEQHMNELTAEVAGDILWILEEDSHRIHGYDDEALKGIQNGRAPRAAIAEALKHLDQDQESL